MLFHSIQRSDMDLRRTFYSNIVLSGGSTMFKGMAVHSKVNSFAPDVLMLRSKRAGNIVRVSSVRIAKVLQLNIC